MQLRTELKWPKMYKNMYRFSTVSTTFHNVEIIVMDLVEIVLPNVNLFWIK